MKSDEAPRPRFREHIGLGMYRILKYATFNTLLSLGILVTGLTVGQRAVGQTPTAEQMEIFQSLDHVTRMVLGEAALHGVAALP